MHKLFDVLPHLIADESGQDLIEYTLVAALLGLGAISAMRNLSSTIATSFNRIGTTISSNI